MPIQKREYVEDTISRGIVIYIDEMATSDPKLFARPAGATAADVGPRVAERINKEQPEDWDELVTLLEQEVSTKTGCLTIFMPQQEHAETLAEALDDAHAFTINLATLEREQKGK